MRTTATLSEIITEWVTSLDVMPATRDDYQRKIKLWFRWLSSIKVDPREPQRQHVLDYKRHLQSIGKSTFTTNSYVTVVKLFYNHCEQQHYYENIGLGIKSSHKKREHYKHPLSQRQSNQLLNSIDTTTIVGKRDKLMIALMLTNGLRTCEVHRANICDLDKCGEQSTLHIQRKGRTDKREVVALPEVIDHLVEEYLSHRDFEISDPLFICHAHGRKCVRLSKQSISAIVKERLRGIGIDDPHITAHSLRHTCGSLMVEQGMDVEDIKDMLGHSNTAITRIYIDMARKRRMLERSPSRKIAEIIFNKGEK